MVDPLLATMPERNWQEMNFEERDLAPDFPGPHILGHDSFTSHYMKKFGLPSAREEVVDALDSTRVVDVRDSPLLPALSTNKSARDRAQRRRRELEGQR